MLARARYHTHRHPAGACRVVSLGLCSGYVCVFCSSGCLPVFPDQVQTLEIQQLLRVPTLGLRGGLADGTLLHGLRSPLRHLHPPENQRIPEAGTEIVVTGQVAATFTRWLMGGPPRKTHMVYFSSQKAKGVRAALP